jgi:hypothetical protein
MFISCVIAMQIHAISWLIYRLSVFVIKTTATYYIHIYRQKHLVRTLMSGAASSLLSISSKDSAQSTAAAAASSSDRDSINDISGQKKVYFALMRLHPIDLRLTYKALPTGDDVISNSNSNGQSGNDNSNSNNSAPAEVGALSTLAQVKLEKACMCTRKFSAMRVVLVVRCARSMYVSLSHILST